MMDIRFFEEERVFKIDTENTSYIMALTDEPGYLGHAYYGPKVSDAYARLLRTGDYPFTPDVNPRDKLGFLDSFPMEYSFHGTGDFRETAFKIRTEGGNVACELKYFSHVIEKGKPGIPGLPACFGDNALTLIITLKDAPTGMAVRLYYSVFEDNDTILRSAVAVNEGSGTVFLERMLSASFDMDDEDFELITLHGSWARERHIDRRPLAHGFQGVSSLRGESSHQHQPFIAIAEKNADQDSGSVYGMQFVYSGNFLAMVYKGQYDNIRMMMGINPEDFCWKLEPGAEFHAPEVMLVYSAEGLGGMSRSWHDLIREHLIRSRYKYIERPILINNWEATYFDFDSDKLLAIAKTAAEHGIEMLVMDDGWFGNRYDDNRALGDWKVNEEKLKGGLGKLVEDVKALGLKFGIWFEPEMVSPDSDLYRAHPDWAIAVPGRVAGLARNQYVLDLSREEVKEYVFKCLTDILDSADIAYVKWDMNRQLADLGSAQLPADRQGELFHRYVLAVYELQERLTSRYPDLLLENCSGGGARFDAGMLYYSPQIWCSDDADAIERLMIQEGTALLYPLSTMGAHVSDCPNHVVGRVTPFETRGYVALAGTFGYELDITKISGEDRAMIPKQAAMYKKYHGLVAGGDYYRIASYSENGYHDSWLCVSKDKSEGLLTFIQVLNRPSRHTVKLKLRGLSPEKSYRIFRFDMESGEEESFIPEALHGDTLMNAGILIPRMNGDFKGILLHIKTT